MDERRPASSAAMLASDWDRFNIPYLGVSLAGNVTEEDRRLNQEGILGVANSADTLMANIQRMLDRPDIHFLSQNLDEVLQNPSLGGYLYETAGLTDSGRARIEVCVRGSGSIEEMEKRAMRNLAYKILRARASTGAEYKVEKTDDSVRVSAIPVLLDHYV